MALTSLFKLSNANTNYFWKVMGYQIQETYARFVPKSSFLFLPFSSVSAFPEAFFLVAVTGVKVAGTNTSFLNPFSWDT